MYSLGHIRKKYEIIIMLHLDFKSGSFGAAATPEILLSTWMGVVLIQMGGGYFLDQKHSCNRGLISRSPWLVGY